VSKLSVTVIARNEGANLVGALQTVAWADELIVVDAQSTDDTVGIARQFTDRVIVREWPGYAAQKNFAASLASHEWVLSLDADERVTPALADDIRRVLASPAAHAAWRIPRVTWYLGRWIRSTDWFPDPKVRLYDRRSATWTGEYVHETLEVSGTIGSLAGELQHFPYRDLSDHLDTIDRYTDLAARQLLEQGRQARLIDVACQPPLAFLRNYLVRAGIRDGLPGLIISSMNAHYVFLKWAKLWELQAAATAHRDDPGGRRH
jgi:glycosyltransferase involved in cell wall biosynthesis